MENGAKFFKSSIIIYSQLQMITNLLHSDAVFQSENKAEITTVCILRTIEGFISCRYISFQIVNENFFAS
jgi:hypothetical protein